MQVVICTFTEGDLNFVGRVFSSEERAHEVFLHEQGQYFKEYGAVSVKDMINFGYVTFKVVEVE